MMKNFGNLN